MKVLLVDDESHVIEGLTVMIDWLSLNVDCVETAANGAEAWDLYVRNKPDFVITDVAMPRMNGLELVKKIRGNDSDIPVIILSCYDDFEYAKEAIHLNVSRYILKPAVYMEIYNVVREVAEELEAARKKRQYAESFLQQIKQELPVLREQFLFDMITQGKKQGDISKNQLQFYELGDELFSGGCVLSIMLYRPESSRVGSERDWQLFKYSAVNIVMEIIDKCCVDDNPDGSRNENGGGDGRKSSGSCFVLRYMEDRLPVLLLDSDAGRTVQRAYVIAAEAIRCIGVYLGIDSNAGIGRWYGSIEQYPISCRESSEVIQLLEYEGYQKISSADETREVSIGWGKYPWEQIRLLTEALLRRDEREVSEYWREVERELRTTGLPLGFIQTICIVILNWIILKVMETDQQIVDDREQLVFIQEMQKSRSVETVLQVARGHLYDLLRNFQRWHEDQRGDKYVAEVKAFVENHYHEAISFANLAKRLNVTRNYLSYLFKRETGINFIHHLTRFRIERAKELLLSGKYMVYEVADQVGYQDPAYFSRVFKNVTGKSPQEYLMPTCAAE